MKEKFLKIKTLQILGTFIAGFVVIFLINYSIFYPFWIVFMQDLIFSLSFTFILFTNRYTKYLIILTVLLFIIMHALVMVNRISYADICGSTGFGLTLLIIIRYLPQCVKLGYIKKL